MGSWHGWNINLSDIFACGNSTGVGDVTTDGVTADQACGCQMASPRICCCSVHLAFRTLASEREDWFRRSRFDHWEGLPVGPSDWTLLYFCMNE